MHPVLEIDELLEYIFDYISSDRPSLVSCTRVSKLFWERSARRLWRELPGGLEPLNRLLQLPWYPTYGASVEGPLNRVELYSTFIREVWGTVLPRHPNIPPSSIDRSQKAGILIPTKSVRFDLRILDVGIETEAALRSLDTLLGPSIEELNVYMPGSVSPDSFLTFLRSLPSKIPDVKRLALLAAEDLVCDQEEVARTLSRFVRLRNLRLILEVGDELLETLGAMALDQLIINFTTVSDILPHRSLKPNMTPVTFRLLRDLDLKGHAHSCADLLERMHLPALETIVLSIYYFPEEGMERLCKAITRSSGTLRVLYIRSLASKYRRGGMDRPFPVSIFHALFSCSLLDNVTLIGGYHGRDRLLFQSEDLLRIAYSWPRLTRLALVAQPWHPRSFRPLLTLEDLIPLVEHCRSLIFLSIAVNLAVPKTSSMANLRAADSMSMVHFDAFSNAPGTKDMEVTVANVLIRMWPNTRLKVDPDSMGSPNELDWFTDHFNERFCSGLSMMTKLWG